MRGRRLARAAAGCLAVLAAGLAALAAWNWWRLDGGTLSREMARVVERSREIREQARPDYQEETLRALPPNPRNGPTLRLDDRLAEAAVRAAPPPAQDEASDIIYAFEFIDALPFAPVEGRSRVRLEDGVLVVEQAADDYLENTGTLAVPMDQVGDVVIAARVERGQRILLGWSTELEPEDPWLNRLAIPVVSNGELHTYVINARNAMKRGVRTGEHIRRLFLSPSTLDDRVEIESIRFLSKRSQYLRAPRGVVHERLGRELRRAIYVLPPQELEWALRVPEEDPRLDFGMGVLLGDEPLAFSVRLEEGGREVELHGESVSGDGWRDARVDLSRWAGRDVRLRFAVAGSADDVAFWSHPVVSSRPVDPFNAIILLEDTLRADRLSTYGHERPTAPFKDRLMEEAGIVFLNMASQSTKTRTSVPSLLTSLLPTATGVWNFADMLSERYLTLPEILRHQGFFTASFVQNGNAGPWAGLHQGFDTVLDAELIGTDTESIFGERLLGWLERHRDRNFFLYLHAMDPHGVYEPQAPYDAWYRELPEGTRFEPVDPHLDPEWVEAPTVEGRRSLYDGEIRRNDAVIERFFGELRRLGLYEQSLVVFTSDHGEYLGERGYWEHQPPGLLPVTGVPLMLVHPERFPGGQRIHANVQTIDVMPTVLELAGVDPSRLLLQGDSLVGLVEGRERERWRDRVTLSEEPDLLDKERPSRNRGLRITGSFFYRERHFIASRRFWPERGYWPEALRMKVFDTAADRGESSPLLSYLADAHLHYRYARLLNDVQRNGIAAWEQWTAESGEDDHPFDPDVLDQLKALGYLE